MKVLISDNLSTRGVEILKKAGLEVEFRSKTSVAYVASLVAHDRIDYGNWRRGRGAAPRAGSRGTSWHSHAFRPSSGRRVLTRVRFSCQLGSFTRPRDRPSE